MKIKLFQLTDATEKKRKLEDICPNCHQKKGENRIFRKGYKYCQGREPGLFCHLPRCKQKEHVEEYCDNCKAFHLFKCVSCNRYYCDESHHFQFASFVNHDPICGWCYFKSSREDKNFSRLLHVLGLEMETNVSTRELFRKFEMICTQHWNPPQSKKKWRIVCLDGDDDEK